MITESTTPTQSARNLFALVGGIGLPDDAKQLVNQDTCAVWSSDSLKKATGHQYAVGFVEVVPEGEATGIVDMSGDDSPNCWSKGCRMPTTATSSSRSPTTSPSASHRGR